MRFSQRFGFKPVKTSIQKESMDQDLRNSLWSALKIHYWDTFRAQVSYEDTIGKYFNQELRNLSERLWLDFFKLPLDNLSPDWEVTYARLRDLFFKWSWDEVYDFIEFVAQNYPVEPENKEFMAYCNNILEREMSAYRFVGGAIAPITSEEEISAINDAMTVKISPVRAHLNSALEKLTDRKNPDYRNAIKESISAVEALVQKTTQSDKGTLGQLLKIMETKTGLHPSLKGAFDKLYGYTSDADGIRHALLDEDKVTFDQAKFMLVVCSAFTNYVIGTLNRK
jgi:hypothetical protein